MNIVIFKSYWWILSPLHLLFFCFVHLIGGSPRTTDTEDEELDLLYDQQLNCYYDPKTCKYYELS